MRQSIGSIILDSGRTDPDSAAVVDSNGILNRGELAKEALFLSRRLRQHGVGCGDADTVTVTFPFHQVRKTVIACCAVWLAGGRPFPVDPDLPDDEQAELAERAETVAALGPDMEELMKNAVNGHGDLPDDGNGSKAATSWKLVASSGSTGRPKLIAANAPALLDPEVQVTPFLPLHARQLVTAPLHRSAPFTYAFRGLFTGHTLIAPGFLDEKAWLTALEQYRVTWTMAPPSFLHRLMALPESVRQGADLSHLETLLHIGSPCPPDLKYRLIDWLGPDRIIEVYAGSESNGLTTIGGREWLEHPGSVGPPTGGTEIAVRDGRGRDVPTGTIGEIWMRRGPRPAYHYVGASSLRDSDGWDTLGDCGYLDDEGYLFLIDRLSDTFRRDSETVYPAQIEAAALRSSLVRDAVAFAFSDGRGGSSLGLVIEADTTTDLARASPRLPEVDRLWVRNQPLRDAAGKTSRRVWARRLTESPHHP